MPESHGPSISVHMCLILLPCVCVCVCARLVCDLILRVLVEPLRLMFKRGPNQKWALNWVKGSRQGLKCVLALYMVWMCAGASACVSMCRITEQRLAAERTVTSLIKRESLHCSRCRHHHRQTSLITLSKCCFLQAIRPTALCICKYDRPDH